MSRRFTRPFGSGRKFLNNSGIASRLAGGWQINGFFTARSGTPFTVTASTALLNAGSGTPQLADQVKDTVEVYGFSPDGAASAGSTTSANGGSA